MDAENRTLALLDRPLLAGRPVGVVLIAAHKLVWGLALVAIAGALLFLHSEQITQPFQLIFANELTEDPHDLLASTLIGLVPVVSPRTELLLAAGALAYAALEAVEAWGVWWSVWWVEVFIVVELAALLPYDLYELVRHPSAFKVVSLAINVAVVWYLTERLVRTRQAHRARKRAVSPHRDAGELGGDGRRRLMARINEDKPNRRSSPEGGSQMYQSCLSRSEPARCVEWPQMWLEVGVDPLDLPNLRLGHGASD